MDRIRIKGGRELRGAVKISGSKNAVLPILASTILIDGPVLLRNVSWIVFLAAYEKVFPEAPEKWVPPAPHEEGYVSDSSSSVTPHM